MDGVVVKAADAPYEPGRRAMAKVKRERTADCVVGGVRLLADRPLLASLLLGLYDGDGDLRHVGVASSFRGRGPPPPARRPSPAGRPARGPPVGGGVQPARPAHRPPGRWTPDMELDWVPLRPVRICEVAYDRLDGDRFRHPARFVRWRPDRDARSCTFDQLAELTLPGGGGPPWRTGWRPTP